MEKASKKPVLYLLVSNTQEQQLRSLSERLNVVYGYEKLRIGVLDGDVMRRLMEEYKSGTDSINVYLAKDDLQIALVRQILEIATKFAVSSDRIIDLEEAHFTETNETSNAQILAHANPYIIKFIIKILNCGVTEKEFHNEMNISFSDAYSSKFACLKDLEKVSKKMSSIQGKTGITISPDDAFKEATVKLWQNSLIYIDAVLLPQLKRNGEDSALDGAERSGYAAKWAALQKAREQVGDSIVRDAFGRVVF